MHPCFLIPRSEFVRLNRTNLEPFKKLSIIADMCRINTLTAVKIAGSGHLGSSFSAMEIVVHLYYKEMNVVQLGIEHPDRDIYFSSKGHDVPGLYSVLHSLGIIPKDKLMKLRRLGGIDGHPDVSIKGIECNTGSLGMGISKGKGIALAKHISNNKGRVFVLTGDGELQEGQIFEALQSAPHQKVTNLIVIVDHNKVQSDKKVEDIIDLGDLEQKFCDFGWFVKRCDGNDLRQIDLVMKELVKEKDKPKILIADTIKGKGVSFMEHPKAFEDSEGIYKWHSGAPDDESFRSAQEELFTSINERLKKWNVNKIQPKEIPAIEKLPSNVSREYVAEAFGEAIVELGERRKDLIVLDADLAADCRIRRFEETYPDRFIENGIAEQDMVSTAGGLALQGFLPVVNSFAAFLTSRANEQIYTNVCEGTRIIYVCHYAGLIPAGPGKSHQSIRDISLLGALPNFEIIQPCNAYETKLAVDYCVNQSKKNCSIRLIIGPSPRIIDLPDNYSFLPGHGAILKNGSSAIIFAYGPVLLHEALVAHEILKENNISLRVVNMPWLNQINTEWLADVIKDIKKIYFAEDHSPVGGLGERMIHHMAEKRLLDGKRIKIFSVEGYPACGTPTEVLKKHGLDGESMAKKIVHDLSRVD